MSKQKKDSLENFFRNRVGEYQFDYREEDWRRLDTMMDIANSIRVTTMWKTAFWAVSGSIIAMILLALIGFQSGLFTFSVDAISPGNTTTQANKIINGLEDQPKELSQNIVEDQNGGLNETFPKESSTASLRTSGVENESTSNTLQDNFQSRNFVVHNKEEQKDLRKSGSLIIKDENVYNVDDALKISKRGWFVSYEHPKADIIYTIEDESSKLAIMEKFAWNFSVATDYSAVGVNGFDGPALRTGIFVEYYLLKRFSAGVGVNYSIKEYQAQGREYSPPKGYWTYGVVPETTRASCNVLDIPINLSYYFPLPSGQRFVVRGGISSWLMLEEHYWYKYELNDPDLVQYWGGENENYHFFSVVNLSAGFEHLLSQRFSVLVEPYFNISLGGVGFGKVDLYSTGIKFSLKSKHYKLVTKNK